MRLSALRLSALRFVSWFGIAAVVIMAAITLGAIVPGPVASPRVATPTELSDPSAEAQPAATLALLVGGAIHYDILLPLNDETRTRFDWLEPAGVALNEPRARWLVVGWGARDFYTSTGTYRDLNARTIWRAITGDQAVMRVDLAPDLPPDIQTRALPLSAPQFAALLNHIEASFAQGRQTRPLPQSGLTDFDVFFPAKGRFHILNTCNAWIGKTLRSAGLRFGAWTPAPFAVTLSHWLYAPSAR